MSSQQSAPQCVVTSGGSEERGWFPTNIQLHSPLDTDTHTVTEAFLRSILLRRTVTLYAQLGSGSGWVGTGDDAGDGARLIS